MHIVQIALRFGVMPSVVEQEPEFLMNRIFLYYAAEAEAEKLK
ncbi:MAG: hypothetical protein ABWZ66_13020 [Pyrinomonadaceae bacterium]